TSLPPPSPCAPGASPPPDRPDIAPPSPSAAAPASATALPLSLAALPPRCNSCFSYNSIPAENSSEKVTASERSARDDTLIICVHNHPIRRRRLASRCTPPAQTAPARALHPATS